MYYPPFSVRVACMAGSLCFLAMAATHSEILTQFDAKVSGRDVTPDLADPPWEHKGQPMENNGEFLLQDSTRLYPETGYGNYVSPSFADLMKVRSGEYGVEFTVRPLTDLKKAGNSHYANLMVAWGDDERSFRIVIDKNSEDDTDGPGALVGKQDYLAKIVGDIDWSKPHTVFLGYKGSQDSFDVYLDGERVDTISAESIACDMDPAFSGRVSFGDFTSGQAAPLNIDLKAEWYSVRLLDRAEPEKAGQTSVTGSAEDGFAVEGGSPQPGFSSLAPTRQLAIRQAVAPPTLGARDNPYTTPMYYPMWRVLEPSGKRFSGSSPDEKFHPEWQEALIADWAELGMTKLHLSIWPEGNGSDIRKYQISDMERAGLTQLAALAKKYQLTIGLRLDIPMDQEGFWPAHPRNEQNELTPYVKWVEDILTIFGPGTEYLVLGDEIDASRKYRPDGKGWDIDAFQGVVKQVKDGIKLSYPQVKVSVPSFGTGGWKELMTMVKEGYGKIGDAVAINLENSAVINKYAQQLKEATGNKRLDFLSNGVGYIASDTKLRDPVSDKSYYPYNDLDQAGLIAQSMYLCWSAGLQTAPYYVSVRSINYKGNPLPMWYGFFGFMDLDIDQQDRASTTRYPGWYAFQTVANVFYDTKKFKEPDFEVVASSKRTGYIKAHERADKKELLIIAWGSEGFTDIKISSDRYHYPVQVDLLNKNKWGDLKSVSSKNTTILKDVALGGSRKPVIIRLVSNDCGA